MAAIYGRDITVEYSEIDPVTRSRIALDPDELITARIYDTRATTAEINGISTRHLAEVTSWVDEGDNVYSVTFPGASVPDINPESLEPYELYHVVFRYRVAAGGPIVANQEGVRVYRPDGWISRVNVTAADMLALQHRLNFKTTAELNAFIAQAIDEIDLELQRQGYNSIRTFERERLNNAVLYKALELASLDLLSIDSESWNVKYEYYRDKVPAMIQASWVGVDKNEDDVPDIGEQVYGARFTRVIR